jgi:hypothetical protein
LHYRRRPAVKPDDDTRKMKMKTNGDIINVSNLDIKVWEELYGTKKSINVTPCGLF